MPNPRTHEENGKIVCDLCLMKKGVRTLSKVTESRIQDLDPNFSLKKQFMPAGICNGCRLALLFLKDFFDFGNISESRLRQDQETSCVSQV